MVKVPAESGASEAGSAEIVAVESSVGVIGVRVGAGAEAAVVDVAASGLAGWLAAPDPQPETVATRASKPHRTTTWSRLIAHPYL